MFKKWKLAGFAVIGAFMLAGPLQQAGVLQETAFGDASYSTLKTARDFVIGPAWAVCGGGGGGAAKGPQGNNGKGNGGGDGVPGNSGFPDTDR